MKGTTNVAFKFKEGIMLGVDSRITSSFENKNNVFFSYTASDRDHKIFQISSEYSIYCTLMGDCEQWHYLFKHLQQNKPTTVREASDQAMSYLSAYKINYADSIDNYYSAYGEELQFGTIIAGYEEAKGYQLESVVINGKRISRNFDSNVLTIGSGADYANEILLEDNRTWHSFGEHMPMSKIDAANLTLKALFKSSFLDECTGGDMIVMRVQRGGCTSKIHKPLDVHLHYFNQVDDLDERTLYMLYPTTTYPVDKEELQTLMNDIWPQLDPDTLPATHLVAKTADFYAHRIVFSSVTEGVNAYADISTTPRLPSTLANLQGCLLGYGFMKSTLRHVYFGRCTLQLLRGICELKEADNFNYDT